MLGNKGFVGMLIFLLPFILIFLGFLLTATVVSMLKLPLSIIGGLLIFFYMIGFLERKFDMGRYYSLALGGMISIIITLFIYSLPLFWIILGLGILFIGDIVIKMFTGVSVFGEIKNILKGEPTQRPRR